MAYLKNWTDNLLQMVFMGTSWVAVSINNVTFGVYTGLAGLLMVVLLWVLFTKCHLW